MADTFTAQYSLTKPEIGASKDTWGNKLNVNFDSLDSILSQHQTALTGLNNAILETQTMIKAWVPIGVIALWVGVPTTIPAGWALCDGRVVDRTDGFGPLFTPNLVGRFVYGTDNPHNIGGQFGYNFATDVQGSHSHGGATAGTALEVGHLPPHSHGYSVPLNSGGASGNDRQVFTNVHTAAQTSVVGSGAAHGHPIAPDGGHAHNISLTVVPPYYALCYIMKY